ncbi:MAG: hypothetical protein V3V06_07265, partial [Dehalococcoidia bacterium]
MADITSRIRRLSQVVAEATVAVLGTGKVAGAEITAAAGVVTVPAGSRIAFGQTGTRPPQAIELTEDVDVSAVNNDELYARQLPGGARFEIAAAASTPGGALKLADLSGTPMDTVVDTSPAEIGAVSANEVAILDAAANYAAETVEAALAEIGGTPPVDSVFGRTGAVAAASGDYDGAEVDYAPALLADWDGSADPGQVDDALDQLAARVTVEEAEIPPPTAPVDSVFSRIGDVVAASGDYTASEVTNVPAGGIAAITVQAAIDELDSEKARSDDLASVVNAKGASLIGVEDSGANYAGADVEAVLAEIAPQLGAAKAFMHATMNQQTTSLALNDHVEFDAELVNDGSGSIAVSSGGGDQTDGIITLAANKTYDCLASLRMDLTAAGDQVRFKFFDLSAVAEFGAASEFFAMTHTGARCDLPM